MYFVFIVTSQPCIMLSMYYIQYFFNNSVQTRRRNFEWQIVIVWNMNIKYTWNIDSTPNGTKWNQMSGIISIIVTTMHFTICKLYSSFTTISVVLVLYCFEFRICTKAHTHTEKPGRIPTVCTFQIFAVHGSHFVHPASAKYKWILQIK